MPRVTFNTNNSNTWTFESNGLGRSQGRTRPQRREMSEDAVEMLRVAREGADSIYRDLREKKTAEFYEISKRPLRTKCDLIDPVTENDDEPQLYGNCHKHLCASRGCGVLISRKHCHCPSGYFFCSDHHRAIGTCNRCGRIKYNEEDCLYCQALATSMGPVAKKLVSQGYQRRTA